MHDEPGGRTTIDHLHVSPNHKIRRGKARPKTSRVGNNPPQIKANVELRHTYRYVSTNGALTGITGTSLLCSAGSYCTVANTTVRSAFSSLKINQIEMYCPPASQGSSATCSVDWIGFSNTPSRQYSDTTCSVSTPAHVRCNPPPMSLASFWQLAGATVLFNLTAPAGTIVDVSVSLILDDDESSVATAAVASGSLGSMYYLSLDPNATHYYTPVSLTTTT